MGFWVRGGCAAGAKHCRLSVAIIAITVAIPAIAALRACAPAHVLQPHLQVCLGIGVDPGLVVREALRGAPFPADIVLLCEGGDGFERGTVELIMAR